MRVNRSVAGFLIGSMFLTNALAVQAAPASKAQKPALPISITADELYFSDKTGEMFARGNVIVNQGSSKIMAEIMRGNEKQTELWVDGKARFQEPLSDITGMKVRYNYGSRFGVIQDIKGKCGDDYISGKQVNFQEGKYTVYGASATGCPTVGTPDYRITARKIEIWPGDKVIAYDAKVWIKNTVIYSTPRYKRSLKKRDENDDEFPRFGYQDTDGFWISQRFSYALTDTMSAYADLAVYSRLGLRPTFGIVDQEKNYMMSVMTGRFRDDNGNWIRKEPEFRFDLYPQRLGKLPLQFTINAIVGQWTDDVKTSWHQDYNAYLRHDPIYFDRDKSWTLNLGTGYRIIKESADNSTQNVFGYNARLSKKLSPALTAWTAYNYADNNNSSFAYNKLEVAREGILGLAWKVNNRTTLSYYTSYDFANSRVFDNYYSVKHSFHCWETNITYRSVKKELTWTVNIVRW